MSTYLLTWNPFKSSWPEINAAIDEITRVGYSDCRWSCGVTKKIQIGDRVFLMRQGKSNPGIIGSGKVIRKPYSAKHWNRNAKKETANYIKVRFDILLDADNNLIFSRDRLLSKKLSDGPWNTQNSGVIISENISNLLEIEWTNFLMKSNKIEDSFAYKLPEEITDNYKFYEGIPRTIEINSFERNKNAREACIKKHGYNCSVCGFNFGKVYGKIGLGFIHVHHKKPISKKGDKYKIDPVNDLIPICQNCHAILHRTDPPLTIENVRELLNKK